MPQTPAINDRENDLLYKLAKNLYDKGVSVGASGLVEPQRGWTDYDLLKCAVTNSAAL